MFQTKDVWWKRRNQFIETAEFSIRVSPSHSYNAGRVCGNGTREVLEKKSFKLTIGIPFAFLMGVSAICVRQQRQFRVRNDLVKCDVDTVQYSLFHFSVNKFISGVNMYNLGVIVQRTKH